MIKTENGNVSISGTSTGICTDMVCVIKGVISALEDNGLPRESAESIVKKSIDVAFLTTEEINAKAEEALTKTIERAGKELAELLFGRKEE